MEQKQVKKKEDNELLILLKQGEEKALKEVMEKYNDKLFAISMKICKNLSDSEEILQDVYMVMIKKIDQFECRSALYTWLYRITVNQALMKLRSTIKHRSVSSIETSLFAYDNHSRTLYLSEKSPEQYLIEKELCRSLKEILDGLKRKYMEAFYIRDVMGFNTKETSIALNISQAAVKSRLFRSRAYIRNNFSDDNLSSFGQ